MSVIRSGRPGEDQEKLEKNWAKIDWDDDHIVVSDGSTVNEIDLENHQHCTEHTKEPDMGCKGKGKPKPKGK